MSSSDTGFWEEVEDTLGTSGQERALLRMQKIYGDTAYTENHLHFRLVGFKRDGKRPFAIGDTWAQAMERLEGKARA